MANRAFFIINTPTATTAIQTDRDLLSEPSNTTPKNLIHKVRNYLAALVGGRRSGSIQYGIVAGAGVVATVSGTFTGAPVADETVTINGVVFTAKDSGATGNQFNIGANVTATALNLKNAINASASVEISEVLTADSSAGTIIISNKIPGRVGNMLVVAEGLTNFTWAATKPTNGSGASPSLSTASYS